jgi:rod shape determining protein RodA
MFSARACSPLQSGRRFHNAAFRLQIARQVRQHPLCRHLVMLLAVMFIGHSALGAQRWIQIGPVSIQPSEFAQTDFDNFPGPICWRSGRDGSTISRICCHLRLRRRSFPVVLKQPDLGTSLVFLAILFGMLFIAGIKMKHCSP